MVNNSYNAALNMIEDVSLNALGRGVDRFGDISSSFHIDIEDHKSIGPHIQMDVGPYGGGMNPVQTRLGLSNWRGY